MIINIDTKVWVTVSGKAEQLGTGTQAVWNRVARGTLEAWHIPQLNITLVKR